MIVLIGKVDSLGGPLDIRDQAAAERQRSILEATSCRHDGNLGNQSGPDMPEFDVLGKRSQSRDHLIILLDL
jgi:hypothetical protein